MPSIPKPTPRQRAWYWVFVMLWVLGTLSLATLGCWLSWELSVYTKNPGWFIYLSIGIILGTIWYLFQWGEKAVLPYMGDDTTRP